MIVRQLMQTCPSQWDGASSGKLRLYVRYQHGDLSIYIGYGGVNRRMIYKVRLGDRLDGALTTDEMIAATTGVLDFSTAEVQS